MYKIAVSPFHKIFRRAKWRTLTRDERRAKVVIGLCVGDSLGATSECEDPKYEGRGRERGKERGGGREGGREGERGRESEWVRGVLGIYWVPQLNMKR